MLSASHTLWSMMISLFYMEVGKIGFREGKQLAQVAKLRFKTRSVFFFFFNFIYLFIYGCVGSSFLCEGFL